MVAKPSQLPGEFAERGGDQMTSKKGARSELVKRRQSLHLKVIGVGKISVSEDELSMDCIVIDWSQGGAQIRLVEPENCPDQFTLFTKDGRITECRVVWRRDANIGVQFLGPSKTQD
jgi:hypothetical protein